MPAARKARWNELLALVGRGLMVRTDSREVRPGEAFVLMPAAGARSQAFLAQALANGAAWIVAGPEVALPQLSSQAPGARLMTVPDAAEALGQLAAKYFRTHRQAMQAVAVTGTNGKTTTVRLTAHLIGTSGKRVGMTNTDGIYIGERRIDTGDCSGPRSARRAEEM